MFPPFPQATVEDVMSAGVLSCGADARLYEVADLVATHRVHAA